MLQDYKISNGSRQILVINCGSTSLKYKLFEAENLKLIKENNFQHLKSHQQALKQVLREIGDLSKIMAVGHRVVHGGKEFKETRKVTKETLLELEKYNQLAPLHNPYNLEGIKACLEYLPKVSNFAVFDTAFFKDLPDKAKIYALPYKFYEQGIERFGFHGISHQYAAQEAAQKLKKPLNKLKLITCHLGGGSSIAAIDKGKVIDTSMGFTPLEGLVMSTRPGDLDPGIILYLMKNKGFDLNKIDELLNHQSGIKGLSGCENFLDLLKAMKSDEKAKLAFEIFIYRAKKYIGAYCAILNGIDALVFTGTVGTGKPLTRNKICQKMDILKNVSIFTIPANEELMIAREVKAMSF
ncbi:MAG: acetate kinase [Parcubacteria group bacterium Athens1014_10]|nr:MAG: acetate kinase [Parcubacteria group bacterium Athens1014_10]TSD05998.1 MAG: acetate kinase [Parcubacteria group bacterium Athens0714_12]